MHVADGQQRPVNVDWEMDACTDSHRIDVDVAALWSWCGGGDNSLGGCGPDHPDHPPQGEPNALAENQLFPIHPGHQHPVWLDPILQNSGAGKDADESIWLQPDIENLDDEVVAWGRAFDKDRSGGWIHLQRVPNAHEVRNILSAVNAPGRGVVGFDYELITWGNSGNWFSRRGKLVGELITRNSQHASLLGLSRDAPMG